MEAAAGQKTVGASSSIPAAAADADADAAAAAADSAASHSAGGSEMQTQSTTDLQDPGFFARLGDTYFPIAATEPSIPAVAAGAAELSKEPSAEAVKAVSGGAVHPAGGAAAGVVAEDTSDNTPSSFPAPEPSTAAVAAQAAGAAELSKEPPAEAVKAVCGGAVHAAGGDARGDARGVSPMGSASISLSECEDSAHLGLQPLGGLHPVLQPLGGVGDGALPLKWLNTPSELMRTIEKGYEGVLQTLHNELNGELSLLQLGSSGGRSGGLAVLSSAHKAAASSTKRYITVGAVVTTFGGADWRVSK